MNGIDVIETQRIQQAIERQGERFTNRIYTALELAYCESKGRGKFQSLAARFAAKEAVSKVLGTGIGKISWNEIEVFNDEYGKPHIRLHGKAQALATELGYKQIFISLSHNQTLATALATGER